MGVGHVANALRDTLTNKEVTSRLLREFKEENNFQPGQELTPELKEKLVHKFTEHIMAEARKRRENHEQGTMPVHTS